MTAAEIAIEKAYRINERLGILCGDSKPYPEQFALARREADQWEASYRHQFIVRP